MVARQAIRFRKRVTRRTTKQRLIDSRKLLRSLRLLAKEVRSQWLLITDIRMDHKKVSQLCHLFIAPDHHPGCFPVVSKWQKTTGLCQDPCLLHTLLIGGGAEGAGQWPNHHTLHEGKSSKGKMTIFVRLDSSWSLTHTNGLKRSIRVYVAVSHCDFLRPACLSVSTSIPPYLSIIFFSPQPFKADDCPPESGSDQGLCLWMWFCTL